jgi:hypothetical protein
MASFSPAFEKSVLEMPVKPGGQELKQQKSKVKKSKIKWNKSNINNPKIPKMRLFGAWALSIGGYSIIFAIMNMLFFVGIYFFPYLLIILAVVALVGLFLVLNGVNLIDKSFIHYADDPLLKSEKIRPLMIRDFIFSGLLSACIVGLLFINFYITAILCGIALFALLTSAFLKQAELKRLKDKAKKITID